VEQVLQAQQPELDRLDSMRGLRRWRDRVLALNEQAGCARGCPLGRLASELAASDPVARAALADGFASWQARLATGLRAMRERGELAADADPDVLALGLRAAAQGGCCSSRRRARSRPRRPRATGAADEHHLDDKPQRIERSAAVVPGVLTRDVVDSVSVRCG